MIFYHPILSLIFIHYSPPICFATLFAYFEVSHIIHFPTTNFVPLFYRNDCDLPLSLTPCGRCDVSNSIRPSNSLFVRPFFPNYLPSFLASFLPVSLPLFLLDCIDGCKSGLQYYENLRMARIFNATFDDPNSLQIDIDDLIENYSATMRRILKHVGVEPTHPKYYSIAGVRHQLFFILVAEISSIL